MKYYLPTEPLEISYIKNAFLNQVFVPHLRENVTHKTLKHAYGIRMGRKIVNIPFSILLSSEICTKLFADIGTNSFCLSHNQNFVNICCSSANWSHIKEITKQIVFCSRYC